jgi:hypothetical protein
MVVRLPPELEQAVKQQAERTGKTPDEVVGETLREALLPKAAAASEGHDEWVRRLRSIATPAGVSLTNEQLSRENLYED